MRQIRKLFMLKFKDKVGNKGFTLTEVIVTMGVIGILASLGVVGIGKVKGTTRQTTCIKQYEINFSGPSVVL